MGPDQAVLVDKLIQTRKDIAKKDEKVEFLEEHIRQLTEELQKKTKSIQFTTKRGYNNYFVLRVIKNYLLREESGVLSTPQMDKDKVSHPCKECAISSAIFLP